MLITVTIAWRWHKNCVGCLHNQPNSRIKKKNTHTYTNSARRENTLLSSMIFLSASLEFRSLHFFSFFFFFFFIFYLLFSAELHHVGVLVFVLYIFWCSLSEIRYDCKRLRAPYQHHRRRRHHHHHHYRRDCMCVILTCVCAMCAVLCIRFMHVTYSAHCTYNVIESSFCFSSVFFLSSFCFSRRYFLSLFAFSHFLFK